MFILMIEWVAVGAECKHKIFYNIYKVELIKIQSKRKATVKLTQCIYGGLSETKTIVVGKYVKRYGEYANYIIRICKNNSNSSSWNEEFEPFMSGTLSEVILEKATGTFMAGYSNNDYLTERVNRLIIRRVQRLLHQTIKLKDDCDPDYFYKCIQYGKKYYYMWRMYERFNKMLNDYYKVHYCFPEQYTLEGRVKKIEANEAIRIGKVN